MITFPSPWRLHSKCWDGASGTAISMIERQTNDSNVSGGRCDFFYFTSVLFLTLPPSSSFYTVCVRKHVIKNDAFLFFFFPRACCITSIDYFNHVEFLEELLTSTPKHSSHPELLRQLALEVINEIPDQALNIYTDGSLSDTGRSGSGIFSNTPGKDVKISIRNPDHCSVFRSELIAIIGALNSYKDSIWILTGSRSSIQYLKNLPKIMDSTGLDILSKLARLGQS
ncbi:RNase H domain-containing protein [Trichonephila clavipes]|nr:RNase H domain-containing protein [Trichonephila clavipes]